jgi:hypothetical protein
MKSFTLLLLGTFAAPPFTWAQPAPPAISTAAPYTPPTQDERFKTYLRHTYGIATILEAGARAGIQRLRDHPKQWPEGAQGYGERYGSAMGMVAVRGTTQYLVADLLREDLRYEQHRESKLQAALEDTFTARRGSDGHRTISIARLLGPISGSVVATATWYPAGYGRREIAKEAGLTYGLVFVRNLIREMVRH